MKKTESDYEEKIGLKYYQNLIGFIGGEIKKKPEDFVVKEITDFEYQPYSEEKEPNYDYLVLRVEAKNWDNNNLIKELSNKLGISKQRISFAGTKDKRAITTQIITIYGIKKIDIQNIDIKDVEFREYGLSKEEISLGDLLGNEFSIKIRDIQRNENIEKIIQEIKGKGIINYYGPQRFGTTRPITHLVGKKLVKKQYEKSVRIYLTKSFEDENPEIQEKRNELEKNWGQKKAIKKALKDYPNYLNYERTLLDQLYKNDLNYIKALRKLPKNLLTMFVHAYQSYLFNEAINKRIEQNLLINDVVKGDVVCYDYYKKDIPNRWTTERVTERNIQKIKQMIKKRKAYPTAPLFGTKTKSALNQMGEIEEKILEKEELELSDFENQEMPEISSTGLRREMIIWPDIKGYETKNNYLEINFFMPKGTYATSMIREFRGGVDGR